MPFAVRVGFVILAHLFVLVKYFFELFFEALSNFLSRTRLCCFVSFAATLIFYQSFFGLSSTFFIFLFPSPDRLDDSLTACISQSPLFLRFRRNSWYDTTVVRICQQLFSNFFKKFQIFFFAPKSPPSAGLFVRSCITWTPGRKLPSAAQVRRKYRNQKH